MTSFDDILSTLPGLDRAQLKQIHDRLLLLGACSSGGSAAPSDGFSDDHKWVYEEIDAMLQRHGASPVPFGVFLRRCPKASIPLFRQATTHVVDFIANYMKPKTRVERVKAMRILLSCVEHDLQDVTYFAVISRLKEIQIYVDRSFPNYLESGMLPMLLSMKFNR